MDKYALITGGSQGIGKAMALECAKRGLNLILIALPGRELEETALEIKSKYNVKVHFKAIDLTEKTGPEEVYNWCRDNHYTVNILVNNAGIAGTALFETSTIEYSDLRIQLNIRALVLLTRYFLPDMKKLDKAFILNVSSMAAFYAIPYKTIYAASKAFVLIFSKALREELRNTSIKVSVVCPNGVRTNPGTYGRINAHGLKGKITQITPELLAKKAIQYLFNGKVVIIPGRINRFLLLLKYIVPGSIQQKILAREFKKEMMVKDI